MAVSLADVMKVSADQFGGGTVPSPTITNGSHKGALVQWKSMGEKVVGIVLAPGAASHVRAGFGYAPGTLLVMRLNGSVVGVTSSSLTILSSNLLDHTQKETPPPSGLDGEDDGDTEDVPF